MRPSTMWARSLALCEAVLRAAPDDLHLVVDVGHQGVAQVQRAGDAVDEGHGVDREVRLQRRALVEVVEDHQRRRVALERDARGGVLPLADSSFSSAMPSSSRLSTSSLTLTMNWFGLTWYGSSVMTMRSARAAFLDLGLGPELDRAPTGAVGVHDPLAAHDERAGGEVGALDERHEVVGGGVGVGRAGGMTASMTSPRLWGGMLVAMPTAMPWLPLTSRFGKRAGQHDRLLELDPSSCR